MDTRAFILIETGVGKTRAVVSALREISEITSVDAVTGPYDVIVVVEAQGLNAVGSIVNSRIHTIDGVQRTVTCLAMALS